MFRCGVHRNVVLALAFGTCLVSCNNDTVSVSNKNTPVPSKIENSNEPNFSVLEKNLEQDSLNIDARLELAANYYSAKNFEKAIFHFQKVYYRDKQNLIALTSLGNLYYDIQQNEKAIEFYEKSLAIDGKNINVRCDMATCYLNSKMPEKAMKILKENIEMNFNHAQSHHNLSVVYKQLGKTKEAEEELQILNKLKTQ